MEISKQSSNQINKNLPYFMFINEVIQRNKTKKCIRMGLKRDINFKVTHDEYELLGITEKTNKTEVIGRNNKKYNIDSKIYNLTIIKNNDEMLKGEIIYAKDIEEFAIRINYDFTKEIMKLDYHIIRLFEKAYYNIFQKLHNQVKIKKEDTISCQHSKN